MTESVIPLQIYRVRTQLPLTPFPAYATPGSAGMDLMADCATLTLKPGNRGVIPTGFGIAVPEGYEAQIRSRSGLSSKYGIVVINSPGTVDSDYRGEVCVILVNLGRKDFTINRGDRIAQMVIAPVLKAAWVEVEKLPPTQRGSGGFGSTGMRG
jgi:dUTP pyrophosphatase